MSGFFKGILAGTVAFGAGFAVLSVLIPVQPAPGRMTAPSAERSVAVPVTPLPSPSSSPSSSSSPSAVSGLMGEQAPGEALSNLAAELEAAVAEAAAAQQAAGSGTAPSQSQSPSPVTPQPAEPAVEPAAVVALNAPPPPPAPALPRADPPLTAAPPQADAEPAPRTRPVVPESAPSDLPPPTPLRALMPQWTPPTEAELALLLPPPGTPPQGPVEPRDPAPDPAPEPVADPAPVPAPVLPVPVPPVPVPPVPAAAPDPATSTQPDPMPGTQAPAAAPQPELAPELAPVPAPQDPPAPAENPAQRPVVRAVPGVPPSERVVEGVITGRLPSIGAGGAALPEAEPAIPDAAGQPAWLRHAASFQPTGLPLFGVVLIDAPEAEGALIDLPFSLTVALDPADPDAARRATAYRAAGHEVLILAQGLPANARASDLDVTFGQWFATLPQAVGVIDPPDGALGGSRALAQAAMPYLLADGHALVTLSRGLNPASQVARAEGVPAAVLFRQLDAGGESRVVIRRFLDRALFEAQQQGRVAVLGQAGHPETLPALVAWRMEMRAGQVDLAPVSALLE